MSGRRLPAVGFGAPFDFAPVAAVSARDKKTPYINLTGQYNIPYGIKFSSTEFMDVKSVVRGTFSNCSRLGL